jgi:arylsulfatase A-like enzyme
LITQLLKRICVFNFNEDSRNHATPWAIGLGLITLILIETISLVPYLSSETRPELLSSIPLVTAQVILFSWSPILFQFCILGLFLLETANVLSRFKLLIIGVVLSAMVSGHSYYLLYEYPPIATYPPLILAFVAMFLCLSLWIAANLHFASENKFWRLLSTWGFSLSMLVCFGASSYLNRVLYVGYYESLHAAILEISHVLLFAGLLSSLAVVMQRFKFRLGFGQIAASVGVLFVVFSLTFNSSHTDTTVRSAFFRYTLLGTSGARNKLENGQFMRASTKGSSRLFDPQGVERFARHHQLPTLPATLELDSFNILLVTLESTRFQGTSFDDKKAGRTPRLADFAKRSGSYWARHGYTTSSCTIQTMGSVMSLSYPSLTHFTIGPRTFDGVVQDQNVTAAEVLSKAGYNTFWVGHNSHFAFTTKIEGLGQGFQTIKLIDPKEDQHSDPKILETALETINSHRSDGKPFFGWIFFESPHLPYVAHYDNLPDGTKLQRYYQETRFMDEHIGRLIDKIEKWKLLENTIVVVFGDHGEALGGHKHRTHGSSLYGEQTRVPLVIHVPGMKGGIIEKPTSVTYLLPWLFLKGSTSIRDYAKKSLRENIGPMLRETNGAVVMEIVRKKSMISSLVFSKYRLVYNFNSKHYEIYNIQTDPRERENLYGKSKALTRIAKSQLKSYLKLRREYPRTTFRTRKKKTRH